tara:strand:+ start:968 stop:1159 length:192 start_codon:yes stop_codon:yes gene_type:complete
MASKNKKKKKNREDYQGEWEDYQDIRNSARRPSKSERKKDKKYLKDMMNGDIDKDSYHDYNDV